jgi:hypothetical protein
MPFEAFQRLDSDGKKEARARVQAVDIKAAFLAFLAIHAMSDDTMLVIDQLTKMGMP